jgi:hypothetical protein
MGLALPLNTKVIIALVRNRPQTTPRTLLVPLILSVEQAQAKSPSGCAGMCKCLEIVAVR